MKTFFITIALLLTPLTQAFAHEGETEITNLAEAELVGPLIAILIIAGAIILARIIRRRSGRQIINKNNQQSYD